MKLGDEKSFSIWYLRKSPFHRNVLISILVRVILDLTKYAIHSTVCENFPVFFRILHKFPLYPKAVSNFVFKEEVELSEI